MFLTDSEAERSTEIARHLAAKLAADPTAEVIAVRDDGRCADELALLSITSIRYTMFDGTCYTENVTDLLMRAIRLQRPALTSRDIRKVINSLPWKTRYVLGVGEPHDDSNTYAETCRKMQEGRKRNAG